MSSWKITRERPDWGPDFEPAPLPIPLHADDLDVLDELLRENGDCDDAEAFADHVKAIMAAYDKLYYGM